MRQKILTLLRNSDSYLSGQDICEKFGVSRTAIWKTVKLLEQQGYQIEAVKNKGYRLLSVPDIVTPEEILSRLHTKKIAHNIRYFPVTDSTNIQAKLLAEEGNTDGLLVIAEEQTKGRGRRGHTWDSHAGDDIFMSLLLKPAIPPQAASMLTLVAALAVAGAVEKETKLPVRIKWPNDIVVSRKKICGILTEMSSEADYIHYVVIGIGINVNTQNFSEEIASMATSLYLEQEKKKRINRSGLIAAVMEQFEYYYACFLTTGDLSSLREEYNRKLEGIGNVVKIVGTQEEIGISEGITDTGELVIRFSDGSKRKVVSGEVSVRGLYGYV